jgi:hypothetical protein
MRHPLPPTSVSGVVPANGQLASVVEGTNPVVRRPDDFGDIWRRWYHWPRPEEGWIITAAGCDVVVVVDRCRPGDPNIPVHLNVVVRSVEFYQDVLSLSWDGHTDLDVADIPHVWQRAIGSIDPQEWICNEAEHMWFAAGAQESSVKQAAIPDLQAHQRDHECSHHYTRLAIADLVLMSTFDPNVIGKVADEFEKLGDGYDSRRTYMLCCLGNYYLYGDQRGGAEQAALAAQISLCERSGFSTNELWCV